MSKKFLRKNEFRFDNNPAHSGRDKQSHPAYITARYGHKYKANSITHSRYTTDGRKTYPILENPNKKSRDKRETRISPPFWQNEKLFSEIRLDNFRFSKKTRSDVRKFNKRFK